MTSIFDQHPDRNSANFVALSPMSFVERTAGIRHKVSRDIRFEAIPKTSTGKIQKFELRKRAEEAIAS